ncbi:HipA domain-containing protein [Sphaerotilus sp.]|uniref:HipA domain-containing protein n=1 Tax=Sphaerotilus sp. TaxID=2093942 RepID=UPI00286DEAC4|nr:HipA domain-containing protein [Sphaerotilus sp.]
MSTADLLAHLQRLGPLTSPELQSLLGKSQPTISRLLRDLGPQVVTLGAGRTTRYAVPQPILGLSPRQSLYWIDATSTAQSWGELTLLHGGRVHVTAPGLDVLTAPGEPWPWFLAPLRAQGFLGRLLGKQLAGLGFDSNPERWTTEQALFAATHLPDAPGAIVLGDALAQPVQPVTVDTADPTARAATYDTLAADVAATLPAGSSAGGEQAKFLYRRADGQGAELVKFSPPHGTPFGDRWSDLLHAEALALQLLGDHGVPVAHTEVIRTPRRTCLVSQRFDRLPPATPGAPLGRLHVVALDAMHQAFVAGPRQHWAATLAELARQRRVPPEVPVQAEHLLHFGRLIGNTDMHFGNLSLCVTREDVAAGRCTLAPLYDMLPMRWRPDVVRGDLDLLPFEPDAAALGCAPARAWAQQFWAAMAEHPGVSRAWRALAVTMQSRIAP